MSRGVGFFFVGFAFLEGDDDAGAAADSDDAGVGAGVLVFAGERGGDALRARFAGGGVGGGVMSSCLVLSAVRVRVLACRLRFRALRLGAACVVVVAARAIVGGWVVRMLVSSLCIEGSTLNDVGFVNGQGIR